MGPYNGPVMELFHENEIEENLQALTRIRSQGPREESLTGSQRSRESGVGSLADLESDGKIEENIEGEIKLNQDEIIEDKEDGDLFNFDDIGAVNSDEKKLTLNVAQSIISSEQGSPSPSLPKRKPVISLGKIEENDTVTEDDNENDADKDSHIDKEDVGSPFEVINTVYV